MSKITFRIIPNASTSELVGKDNGVWKIRISSPPIDGKANKELIRLLADVLDLAPSEIEILKGHSSKIKTLDIPLTKEEIEERLI
ncbi:MAG: DUF167 domain-containing protein [Patescibacteria group bacterium]|nr:DUF167 domain-containing protein [Patescibacteria group bacterium]MBU2509468.1 DUF167 domain-containing protein [Patescibacteria group bacterium]